MEAITKEEILKEFKPGALIERKTPTEENDLESILESVRIDPNEPLSPPKNVLAWVSPDGSEIPICSRGNFSLNIGKAKSRKSFNISLMAAAYLTGAQVEGIKGTPEAGKEGVIIFDTEQDKWRVQRGVKRVCKMIGRLSPENFEVYCLRKFNAAVRLNLIEDKLYRSPNIGLVVFDGVRDLVTSINDEEQASMLSSKLLKWTEELDIHIITILHQNKNDSNARGHLGTELVNKAETTLTITKSPKDKNISIVEAEFCRDRDFGPYAFEINQEGIPVLAENWETRTSTKKGGVDPQDVEGYKIYKILTGLFSRSEEIGYGELWRGVKFEFASQNMGKINDNKAKDIVTYSKRKGWVVQDQERRPYKLGQYED